MSARFHAVVFLALASLVACRNDEVADPEPDPEPIGTGTAVLAVGARVLDEEALDALESVGDDGALRFATQPASLEGLTTGDVLIAGTSKLTPHGALWKVESVARDDAGLVVASRPAELTEAFRDLAVSLQATLRNASRNAPQHTHFSGPVSWWPQQEPLGLSFPFRFEEGSGDNQMVLEGALSIGSSLDLTLDFDIASLSLEELSLEFAASETFTAELTGRGTLSFDPTLTLGTLWFAPITILIPIPAPPYLAPVVLTPRLSLTAGLLGSIQGEVSASVTQRAQVRAGVGYKDGRFGGFSDDDSMFDVENPEYQASASLRAFAGPRMEVLLYGAVGPFASVEAFVEAGASVEGPPLCVQGVLDAGLRATVGVSFLADYEAELFDHRFPLSSFDSCSNDPNAPRPALTWARSFGRAGSPGETAKAVLEASDGTYLVVGDSQLFDGITGFAASIWAVRLDALGNVIWQRAFRRDADIGMSQAVQEVPGGFLVAGTAGVMKLDTGGNVIWAEGYTTDAPFEISTLAAHADGTFVVAGRHGAESQAWAMKLDENGAPLWSRGYGGVELARVRSTADGGYVMLGYTSSNAGDIYLIKTDTDGTVLFARALDNRFDATGGEEGAELVSSGDRGFDIAEKPDGGYIVAGETYGSFPVPEPGQAGFYASWIVELDGAGALAGQGSVLHRAPGQSDYGGAFAVGVRPNGSTLVVARHAADAADLLTNEDVLLIQGGNYTSLGQSGNDSVYGGTLAGISRGMPLQLTADGGAILAVTSGSFASEDQVWLLKLNRTGSINAPYRNSVDGASLANEHAQSISLSPGAVDVAMTANAFAPVFESTEMVSLQQTP